MPVSKTIVFVPGSPERRAARRLSGRYIVTFEQGAHPQVSTGLLAANFRAATALAKDAKTAKPLPRGHFLLLEHAGIGVVDPLPGQEADLHALAQSENAIVALEPERIVRAVNLAISGDYVRGWRDSSIALAEKLLAEDQAVSAVAAAPPAATWGLIMTNVLQSRYSGSPIKLAVLDTGLDLAHPDFANRNITTQNFVGDNTPFHDGVGHGTHCTGTSAGPLKPTQGPRYGIAFDCDIFSGRVLDDTGRGGDFNILQGIDWAIGQHCDLVSLSLGAPWVPGDPPFSQAYEAAAQRALTAGCLLVVAAGNDADDPQYVGAVGTPGNSPSVLTVAAIDNTMATASFSNRQTPQAPGVKGPDLAGPGVDVYSSWPVDGGKYRTISGTSMATPHVAGIAALFAQANSGIRGQSLKDLILSNCSDLPNASFRRDEIGHGLVRAP